MADRDLAPDEPALLECRIVDGWQYGDIAVHLGVPRDVLTDRVRRLRTDLRRKAKALGAGGFAGDEQAGALGLRSFEDGALERRRSRWRPGPPTPSRRRRWRRSDRRRG